MGRSGGGGGDVGKDGGKRAGGFIVENMGGLGTSEGGENGGGRVGERAGTS